MYNSLLAVVEKSNDSTATTAASCCKRFLSWADSAAFLGDLPNEVAHAYHVSPVLHVCWWFNWTLSIWGWQERRRRRAETSVTDGRWSEGEGRRIGRTWEE
ncbi:unnamed protein product [Boreogadus saida]